ncbi:carotenoid oxygenase family protein [Streptomyces albireticuli]|uniref:Dioxygenase n=1 Tax=Streptomyces albireticuli TaxID=1940 RepID=A0A2A2D3X2_9ACTN|nr:carotenoid oxygenase family protein [Streptomyces albireticuli]MCD9143873.1 carotenoid oxygenase family protein [Streptomyces albireticuli]MCD9161696.1 carotenoid oxygenase family protein [Streptomyces albireticuli]MCD9191990.1 carotenoid oxygenase family protein [Streptomyces albireticuli]PAU46099.1 carotenoid oxygenase [Streptomyces albireticuli]
MTQDAGTARAAITNRYLSGLYAPVREEITAVDLPVTGRLPESLRGRYLRNGPNPLGDPDPATYGWFGGEGMVHGVRLRDGNAEWYRNRWVRSDAVAGHLGEKLLHGPRHLDLDFAPNTHVQRFAGHLLALVEGGSLPYELDDELHTIGPFDFHGTLPGGLAAHTVIDPASGELHTVAYCVARPYVQYLVAGTDGRVRHRVDIPVEGRPLMHDFSLTERHVLLYDLPVVYAAPGPGAELSAHWDDARPARLGVLPRDGGAKDVRWLEIDPCFVFHPMNAHERDGVITVHLVRYERLFDSRAKSAAAPSRLERWTVDLAAGSVRRQPVDDRPVEFPRADPRRLTGRNRFGYAMLEPSGLVDTSAPYATGGAGPDRLGAGLVKYDLERGTSECFLVHPAGDIGEGAFVPAAPDAAEDDGWVLAYAYDPERAASDLVVLAAQDFAAGPVATVHLPVRVPLGFHGNWIPDGE